MSNENFTAAKHPDHYTPSKKYPLWIFFYIKNFIKTLYFKTNNMITTCHVQNKNKISDTFRFENISKSYYSQIISFVEKKVRQLILWKYNNRMLEENQIKNKKTW